jgi:hypothetical protein
VAANIDSLAKLVEGGKRQRWPGVVRAPPAIALGPRRAFCEALGSLAQSALSWRSRREQNMLGWRNYREQHGAELAGWQNV